ncbi:helix-turn-helix domain-containing protein [Frankia sp. AiPs1]|uniref:helix-turn-helix domain-containing protein n=1 Tax=Frankia sp. AiPs1 TaxID=573493 RepID=UPI0020446633|nr:helix-turn-helix transcriptional regulator [Frankia sp. AiPs1]MCM3920658.1 helix-turn-helix domain-containing protein [Frankia sp. AiPs1]
MTTAPTMRRRKLGAELRRLRLAAGLTMKDAAKVLRSTESKVSRMENGHVPFRQMDIEDLLDLYGIKDAAVRAELIDLVQDTRAVGWWHTYSDAVPQDFELYLGLEAGASKVSAFTCGPIEGLLQTPAYAAVLIRGASPSASDDEVDRRVRLRLERQKRLTGASPPHLWAIMDEAVLRRPIGGADVFRDQLRHLVRCAERPNITVQVLPFGRGWHPAVGKSFTILGLPEDVSSDVVYVEEVGSSLYVEKPDATARYKRMLDELIVMSLPPDESVRMIKTMSEE